MNKNKIHRHSFIVIERDVCFQADDDFRSTEVWVKEEKLLPPDMDFEDLLRGTYDTNGIHFFKGAHFRAVPTCVLHMSVINEVYNAWVKRYDYHYCDLPIWTGMEMAEVGTLWRPRRLIGIYRAEGIVDLFEGRH